MRLLYLHPSFMPPPARPEMDRFCLLPEELEGDVIQAIWCRSPEEVEALFGPGSYPVFDRGRFRYHFFLAWAHDGLARRFLSWWFFIRKAIELHRRRPFDCLMAYSHQTMGCIGVFIKWLTGLPLIIEIVTSPEYAYLADRPQPTWKDRLAHLYSDLSLYFTSFACDRLHLLHEAQLDAYPRLKKIARSVFVEFVAVGQIQPRSPADEAAAHERFVFLVGAPWFLKGADLLVDAFRRIQDRFPGWKLRIQGYFDDLDRHMPPGGFGPGIEIWKAVENQETLRRIRQASILVLASRCEGTPRVLIEGMASGLPLIGSRLGGIPALVRHEENGLLFPPRDAEALANALSRLMADEALRQRMGEAGQRIARTELDESTYARKFLAMIRDTVKGAAE